MARPLTVTDETSNAAPPEADAELTLANYEFTMEGELSAGEQTVAVHHGERDDFAPPWQTAYLIRLAEGESTEQAATWAEESRGAAPSDFVGGTVAMLAGNTVYFTADLKSGRYAWISYATPEKGMMKTFTVE